MSFEEYYQAIEFWGSLIQNLAESGGKTREELGSEKNFVVFPIRESLGKI